MKRVGTSMIILCLITTLPLTLLAQISAPSSKPQEYSDTAAGLHDQLASIVDSGRSHDDIAFRGALDSLRIPREWLVANFDPHLLPQVSREYDQVLRRYQEHISWVVANFAKFDDFAVNVQPLESPAPINVVGKFVAPVNAVKVEPFRLSSASSDPQHAPPSWVSSFAYIDGYFRYVGGTYTFWDEGLDGVRGPASTKENHSR